MVEMSVGETLVIHGIRGECGQEPQVDPNMRKETLLGFMHFGNAGVRMSRSCNGATPAIEVLFTASKVGEETLELFGDVILITVVE